MARQSINLGTAPTGVGGDTARTAFEKINSMFSEIYGGNNLAVNSKALNSLTGANGKFPVFTGPGAIALRDIVGLVSQVGGIPTGALFERGANSSGEYVRFAGGIQLCMAQVEVDLTLSTPQLFPFPAAFVANGRVIAAGGDYDAFVSAASGNAWASATAAITPGQNSPAAQRWQVVINAPQGANVTNRKFNLLAVGFWY